MLLIIGDNFFHLIQTLLDHLGLYSPQFFGIGFVLSSVRFMLLRSSETWTFAADSSLQSTSCTASHINISSLGCMQMSPINLCELILYPWVHNVLHALSPSLMNVWWWCQLRCRCEGSTCSEHRPDMTVCHSRLKTEACVCVIINVLFFWKVFYNGEIIRVTPMTALHRAPLFSVLMWCLISKIYHGWSVVSLPSHVNYPERIFVHRCFIFFSLLLKVFCFVVLLWEQWIIIYCISDYTENVYICLCVGGGAGGLCWNVMHDRKCQ